MNLILVFVKLSILGFESKASGKVPWYGNKTFSSAQLAPLDELLALTV